MNERGQKYAPIYMGYLRQDESRISGQWGIDQLFNKWPWKNQDAIWGGKKIKWNLFLTLYLKINSRWINVLNKKNEILKELEKNHRGFKIYNLGKAKEFAKYFLSTTQTPESHTTD